jgi:hypothetical protein
MNFKTTYILFGCCAVLLLCLGIAWFMSSSTTDSSNKFVFPSLNDIKAKFNPDDVDRIEIARAGSDKNLTFKRDNSTKHWTINGLRANSVAVSNLVRSICTAQKTDRGASTSGVSKNRKRSLLCKAETNRRSS